MSPAAGPVPGVCVVIPHHTRRDLLPRALAAVAGWPVLVVHDPPPGGDGLDGDALGPGVDVLQTPTPSGFAGAVNMGLQWAQDREFTQVLVLNDDAAPEPGCVGALVGALAPGVGAVGPVLVTADGRVESAGISVAWWGRVRHLHKVPAHTSPVPALSGACLLVRATARFDQGYAHGFEDVALCRTLRNEGQDVRLVPGARCVHEGGASLPRRSAEAQRHAVAGHLRLVDGGWRTGVVVGLAAAQVVREGGPWDRWRGIVQGLRDHRNRRPGE